MATDAETMNFGPQWLRQLSDGNSISSPPPNPALIGGPLSKIKPPKYIYDRDQMLELFRPNPNPPNYLEAFPEICHEEPQTPLLQTKMTPNEQRAMNMGVNSSIVLKRRGDPSENSRGRGRGRGGGGRFSFIEDDDDDDRDFDCLRSGGRGNRGRGGYENTRRGASNYRQRNSYTDLGSSWQGGTGNCVEDALSGGDEELANFHNAWRPGGSAGSVNNGGETRPGRYHRERTPSESDLDWRKKDPVKGSEKVDRGGATRWGQRTGSAGDRGRPGYTRGSPNSSGGIPEWSFSDVDPPATGCFDASGTFISTERRLSWSPDDNGDNLPDDWEKDFDEENCSGFSRQMSSVSTETRGMGTCTTVNLASTNSALETGTGEEEKAVEEVGSRSSGDGQESSEYKDELELLRSRHTVNGIVSVLDDPHDFNEADLARAVDNLVEISEPTVLMSSRKQVQQEPRVLNGQGSQTRPIPDSSESKYLKTGQSDMSRGPGSTVTNDSGVNQHQDVEVGNQWFYLDPSNVTRGPFTDEEMHGWYMTGYFSSDLMMRRQIDSNFSSLATYVQYFKDALFTSPTRPPAPQQSYNDSSSGHSLSQQQQHSFPQNQSPQVTADQMTTFATQMLLSLTPQQSQFLQQQFIQIMQTTGLPPNAATLQLLLLQAQSYSPGSTSRGTTLPDSPGPQLGQPRGIWGQTREHQTAGPSFDNNQALSLHSQQQQSAPKVAPETTPDWQRQLGVVMAPEAGESVHLPLIPASARAMECSQLEAQLLDHRDTPGQHNTTPFREYQTENQWKREENTDSSSRPNQFNTFSHTLSGQDVVTSQGGVKRETESGEVPGHQNTLPGLSGIWGKAGIVSRPDTTQEAPNHRPATSGDINYPSHHQDSVISSVQSSSVGGKIWGARDSTPTDSSSLGSEKWNEGTRAQSENHQDKWPSSGHIVTSCGPTTEPSNFSHHHPIHSKYPQPPITTPVTRADPFQSTVGSSSVRTSSADKNTNSYPPHTGTNNMPSSQHQSQTHRSKTGGGGGARKETPDVGTSQGSRTIDYEGSGRSKSSDVHTTSQQPATSTSSQQQSGKTTVSMASVDDLVGWFVTNLEGISVDQQVDIPTLVELLIHIESPFEVEDYLQQYLGSSPKLTHFTKQFLEKRRDYRPSPVSEKAVSDQWQCSGGGGGRRKSKKKRATNSNSSSNTATCQ